MVERQPGEENSEIKNLSQVQLVHFYSELLRHFPQVVEKTTMASIYGTVEVVVTLGDAKLMIHASERSNTWIQINRNGHQEIKVEDMSGMEYFQRKKPLFPIRYRTLCN